jgi:RNA polymerase sigma-70 factor (ECF subfamily)
MTSEEELYLAQTVSTDRKSFLALYDATYPKIFQYIIHRCSNYTLAQDLTSETYLKALTHIDQYAPQPDKPFIAWLYRIAANELNMYFRKQKKYTFTSIEEFPELGDVPVPPHEKGTHVDANLSYALVQHAVQSMEPIDQTIISLRFFEDKTIAEIADVVETREGTVKSRLSRALKKLRLHLQRQGHDGII